MGLNLRSKLPLTSQGLYTTLCENGLNFTLVNLPWKYFKIKNLKWTNFSKEEETLENICFIPLILKMRKLGSNVLKWLFLIIQIIGDRITPWTQIFKLFWTVLSFHCSSHLECLVWASKIFLTISYVRRNSQIRFLWFHFQWNLHLRVFKWYF